MKNVGANIFDLCILKKEKALSFTPPSFDYSHALLRGLFIDMFFVFVSGIICMSIGNSMVVG